jgi:hypothetical protein
MAQPPSLKDPAMPEPTDPTNPPSQSELPKPDAVKTPPPRKRRRWPFVLLGIFLVLLLLVFLAPKIASTAAMRGYVVGKINDNLNGTVSIDNWSLGWTGGIDLHGLKVFDERKAEILSVAHAHIGLSLLDAIRGKYHFGDTTVDEPNVEQFIIYPDGSNNFQKLAKPSPKSKPSQETPDIRGNFTFNRMRAMINDQRTNEQLIITPDSSAVVKIKSLNDPIENALVLVYRLGSSGSPGTIKLNGTANVTGKPFTVDEKLDVKSLPLQAANPFLSMAGQKRTLAGELNGAMDLKVTPDGQRIVKGQLTATDFVLGGDLPFNDKQIILACDIANDDQKNLKITALKLDAAGSDAIHLSATGSVLGIGGPQALQDVKLALGYDLEKIWPIIVPLFAPETQKDFKDVKIAGKFQREFTFSGNYPANKPFNEAVASLKANGGLAIGRFDGMGANVENFDVKLALANGILTTQGGGTLNKGRLTLDGAAITLTAPDLRLSIPKGLKLLSDATINTLLTDNIGKYINPVFPNSKRAQGLLDVTIDSCENVGLGAAMKTPQSGDAKVLFSLRDMDIANPIGVLFVESFSGFISKAVPANLVGLLNQGNGVNVASLAGADAELFDGEIQNGVITLHEGKVTEDVTFNLIDPALAKAGAANRNSARSAPMPLTFRGDIHLLDLTEDLKATLPTELIGKYFPGIRKELAQIFPNGIPMSLKGPTTKPKIAYDVNLPEVQQRLVAALTKNNLGSVIGGKSGNKEDNPLGGLLDAVTGNKNAKKGDPPPDEKMDEKTPADDASPRRARLPRYRTTTPTSQPAPAK